MRAQATMRPRARRVPHAPRRTQPRLPRARRDRRDGGLRARADPALAARDDLRPTALVNREAAEAGPARGPRPDRCASCRCAPATGSSGCAASSSTCRGSRRAQASTCSTASPAPAPAWGGVPRVTTIHDLIYRVHPEAHSGLRTLGMRVLVPAAARRSRRVIVDARATRRTSSSTSTSRRSGSTSCRSASAPPRAGRADAAGELRARLDLGARPSCSACRPSARTRTSRGLIDALAADPAPSDGRCSCCPATRRRTRRSCARKRGALASPATCASSAGSRPRISRASTPAARVRVPLALRGLRPAGARGDGARRARRLLATARRCRGRRRRGAAVRPRVGGAIAGRSSGCSATRRSRERLRAAGAAQAAVHMDGGRGGDGGRATSARSRIAARADGERARYAAAPDAAVSHLRGVAAGAVDRIRRSPASLAWPVRRRGVRCVRGRHDVPRGDARAAGGVLPGELRPLRRRPASAGAHGLVGGPALPGLACAARDPVRRVARWAARARARRRRRTRRHLGAALAPRLADDGDRALGAGVRAHARAWRRRARGRPRDGRARAREL